MRLPARAPSSVGVPSGPARSLLLAVMLAGCGLVAILPVVAPSYRTGSQAVRVVVGLLALFAAGALTTARDHAGRRSQHAALLVGVAVVTASVWNGVSSSAPFGEAILYGWVLSLAFALFSIRTGLAYLLLVAAAHGAVLATHWRAEQLTAWVVVLVALGVPAVVIGYLLARIEELALQDPLTGLFNRRAFVAVLDAELSRSARHGDGLALVALDLDDLKTVNDREGHAAGDRLISEAARSWHRTLRGGDVMARLGGDEFGLVLPGCDTPQRAREAVERLHGAAGEVSVSIGVALWQGEGAAELMSRADAAMYQAKAQGKNRLVLDAGTPA